MFKTAYSIQKEAEMVRRALNPSDQRVVILHMWRPGDEPSDTKDPKLPVANLPNKKSVEELIAEGRAQHKRLIVVHLGFEERLVDNDGKAGQEH